MVHVISAFQQCTVWSSDRSRRMRNLMRSQLFMNFLK
ncbi:H repeat-associated protein [Escherichia coli O157:H7 str. TW14359]|nr:H repeat-associated protein [Escherichia coli O157:H7 str. TW14359]